MTSFDDKMTLPKLRDLCKQQGLYRTPSVNDKLYLHYQGFGAIDGEVLGLYTGVRCLWLQGNGLRKIEGLEKLVELRTLCLHENTIEEIEGLETLVMLDNLNLSKNFIRRVSGLEHLRHLVTLNLANNSIGPGADALEHVLCLPQLQTLDVQANRIEDGDGLLRIAKGIPALVVLYAQGNSLVKTFRYYRKRFLANVPLLKYLDDRPVFPDERRRVRAWGAVYALDADADAANDAERNEIQAIRDDKAAEELKRLADFDAMIKAARASRPVPRGPTHGVNFSGERIVGAEPQAPPQPFDPTNFVDVNELD